MEKEQEQQEVIGREQARQRGLKRYYTGVPCGRGHLSPRYVINGSCIECSCTSRKPQTGRHLLPKVQEYQKAYRQKNKETIREYQSKYRIDNAEKLAEQSRDYYSRNREYRIERHKQYYHSAEGRSVFYAALSKRRASKINATPAWSDQSKIRDIYAEAARVQKASGVPVHVDHYYPLLGKTVCGLHVPENLRIITKEENLSKKRKHPDDWELEKSERRLSYPSLDQYLNE